jgi:hypothetical protein
MAKYKCDPNYEVIRPNIYVQFSPYGDYETQDEKVIAVLDACAPFVKRVDKAESKPQAPVKKSDDKDADKPKGNAKK